MNKLFLSSFFTLLLLCQSAFAWDSDFRELVKSADYATIEKAIKNGADVNFQPDWESDTVRSWTPLLSAISENRADIVQLLLKYNADPNAYFSRGIFPLMIAAEENNVEIIEILIKNGAIVDQADGEEKTALIYATREGNLSAMELLLKNGANINHQDVFDYTALHYAASSNSKDAYNLLLEKGADQTIKTEDGHTAEDLLK